MIVTDVLIALALAGYAATVCLDLEPLYRNILLMGSKSEEIAVVKIWGRLAEWEGAGA